MSRCFPFPPPGYERKLDDTDLLKKEKSKEKKHKKDKKDREKRDGKEKKHKEKKDKHKEKKKDKEKRVDPQFESQNGDPLLRNNEHNKPKDDSSGHKKSSLQPQNGDHKESLVRKETGQNEKMSVNRIMTESNVDRINKKSTLMVQDMINGKNTRERVKDKTENKYLKNGETVGSYNNLSTSNTPNVRIQHSSSEVKKRKDMEENGFYHENEPWPNKMVRPRSGILTENGLSQQSKSSKVNGTIASQPMSLISKKPPIATANHITNKPLSVSSTKPFLSSKKKESIRAPHPDSKSLKQILTVPELDQWSGLDSQDWLFSSKDDRHFKKKVGKDILQDNKEVEVWSEAKQLESVDVCALPYVIPY